MKKIAIIIPTIYRNELLKNTIQSIMDVYDRKWKIFVIDQNREPCLDLSQYPEDSIEIVPVDHNVGISHCRNTGVWHAYDQKIKYCFISADSIEFSESMKNLIHLTKAFPQADLIGLDIINRKLGWEANLKLIPNSHFELDFIEKSEYASIHYCDIVRNFFLAKTKSLLDVKWDNDLKMMEHEDFFYRYKMADYKVAWINSMYGKYIDVKTGEYGRLRAENMDIYRKVLMAKYNLKGWVDYKHLERAKNK